jgi:hypothetical protein
MKNKTAEFLFRISFANNIEMSKRITVMIDDELDKKLRQMQAKLIQKENKSISYSHVINVVLRNSMKK